MTHLPFCQFCIWTCFVKLLSFESLRACACYVQLSRAYRVRCVYLPRFPLLAISMLPFSFPNLWVSLRAGCLTCFSEYTYDVASVSCLYFPSYLQTTGIFWGLTGGVWLRRKKQRDFCLGERLSLWAQLFCMSPYHVLWTSSAPCFNTAFHRIVGNIGIISAQTRGHCLLQKQCVRPSTRGIECWKRTSLSW